jgi:hypothetical protein
MDKASKDHFTLEDQVQAWNTWNETTRGTWNWSAADSKLNVTSMRQAELGMV